MVDLDSWNHYGLLLDAGSGILYIVLGIFVATVRPRRRLGTAFALFAALFGLSFVISNTRFLLGDDAPFPGAWRSADTILRFLSAAALVPVALLFPRGLARKDRSLVAAAAGLAAAYGLARMSLGAVIHTSWRTDPGAALLSGGEAALFSAYLLFLFLLPLRYAASDDARERRQYALVSAALVPYLALHAGIDAAYVRTPAPWWAHMLSLLLAFAMGAVWALWMRNAGRADRGRRLHARDLALLPLSLVLAGLLFAAATDPDYAYGLGLLGAARTIGVVILTYAILRHQLFDIDVRIKWTIKQSTVAAIFIAVFFVASEGAQAVFSDRMGTAFGIVAAGALVFAIHPLQHLAQRVSDKAMPNVASDEGAMLDKKRAAYREALALAWADGVLNEREAAHLADLRDVLGLAAEEYERLDRERLRRSA